LFGLTYLPTIISTQKPSETWRTTTELRAETAMGLLPSRALKFVTSTVLLKQLSMKRWSRDKMLKAGLRHVWNKLHSILSLD